MVDEAYVEFADDSFGAATTAQGLIAEHPNLVILHTLSKAFRRRRHASGLCDRGARGHRRVRGDSPDLFGQRAEPGRGACLRACPRCVRARGGTGCIRARARAVRPARNGCRGPARGGMAERGELCSSCARRMPRACASVCATSIRFWCATLATRRGLRTVCALPWVRPQENDEVLAAFAALVKEEM